MKSNIGHTQAAAGVAGVIKMVHGDAARGAAADAARGRAVAARGLVGGRGRAADRGARVAGRRSAAPGGRVVVRHQRHQRPRDHGAGPRPPEPAGRRRRRAAPPVRAVACCPARTDGRAARAGRTAARRLAAPTRRWPRRTSATSLATARAALEHRAVVRRRRPRTALLAGLTALAAGEPAARSASGARGAGQVAFLFTGQGAQRRRDGPGAVRGVPGVRRRRWTRCARRLDPHLARPLREVLFGDDRRRLLDQTGFTQPALFAVEVALFRLVESWGVRRTAWSGIRSVRSPPRTWPGCCRWRTRARWWRRGAG